MTQSLNFIFVWDLHDVLEKPELKFVTDFRIHPIFLKQRPKDLEENIAIGQPEVGKEK